MARVIFLNRFYWPDEPATAQLLTDLAERLAARGHTVTVITSHPGGSHVPRTVTHRGVHLVRLGRSRGGRTGLAGKAADWGTFLLGATWRLWEDARRGDVVVAMTDPPLLAIGAWLAAALRGARLVHWVQDIYPELAVELTRQGWLAALKPLRNLAWRRADRCVALGADLAAVLAANGVAPQKISVLPNWAPAGLAPTPAVAAAALRAKWGLADKFVVAYSGNLGRVHDLQPVLALADALRAESHIAFVLIGAGAQRLALETEATRRGLANVHFHPPQPRAQLAETLAVGDAHLVTLLPGCERYVFPSKFYGIAAIGRPVIFIGPRNCELARLVVERDLGIAYARTELPALASAVRTLAADPACCHRHAAAASRFAAASGGADDAAARWHELLAASELADNARA